MRHRRDQGGIRSATPLEIARCRLSQAAKLACLAVAAGGCAAVGETVRHGADLLAGSPPPPPQAIESAAAGLPAPWNYVAVGVASLVTGLWGYHYRKRLLDTPPPTSKG